MAWFYLAPRSIGVGAAYASWSGAAGMNMVVAGVVLPVTSGSADHASAHASTPEQPQ